MNKLFLTALWVFLFTIIPPAFAEPYCFVKDNGELECIDVGDPVLGGGAGGGGCGGSSACGNNNMEIDWIDIYSKKHPELSNENDQFEKILKEYNNRSIRIELSPEPALR